MPDSVSMWYHLKQNASRFEISYNLLSGSESIQSLVIRPGVFVQATIVIQNVDRF